MNVEIFPRKLCGTVSAPSSKSVAHRALICASLADKKSYLKMNTFSDDISATINCLKQLGTKIEIDGENVTVTPTEKYPEKVILDCGESGSTLRFLLPVVSALGVEATFIGKGRLFERPIDELLDALEKNGAKIKRGNPLCISGKLSGGKFSITGEVSSQFVSGLLLALPLCSGEVEITGEIKSKPYIDITLDALKNFGIEFKNEKNKFYIKKQNYHFTKMQVEGDWSNSACLLASGATVKNLDKNSAQGDKKILEIFEKFGAKIIENSDGISVEKNQLFGCEIDATDIPDLVPVVAVIASTAKGETVIKNTARLHFKESDRVASTVELVNSLGGIATATENEIIIHGVETLNGGTVESFNDHRIVMAAASAAQSCKDSVVIKNTEAVNKSYPQFFEIINLLGGVANVL